MQTRTENIEKKVNEKGRKKMGNRKECKQVVWTPKHYKNKKNNKIKLSYIKMIYGPYT